MSLVPGFFDSELHSIRELLTQRYKKDVELELSNSELALDRKSDAITICPTLFWYERGVNFVIFKIGNYRYRTQFFYTPNDQFGTGIDEYNDLDECVAAILKTQSDHERDPSTTKQYESTD